MGERKVLNKYYPPDFDPKKVPRMKRDPEKQIGVRMMIPFSMQCNTCGEFMYRCGVWYIQRWTASRRWKYNWWRRTPA